MKKIFLFFFVTICFVVSANAQYRWSGCSSDKPTPQKIELHRDGACTFIDTDGTAYDGTYTITKQGTNGGTVVLKFENNSLRTLRGDVYIYNGGEINWIKIDGELFSPNQCPRR